MTLWIETNTDFAEFCREASRHSCLALDTEFIWTNTYYPKLALIQIAWDGEHAALVDPLAVTDTYPLAELLENTAITKVLHEATSDLPILRRWCGDEVIPQAIFDTRVAAAFCCLSMGCSLNKLLTDLLKITLEKSETRSDWLQRPLSESQLQYAAEDVIYLPALREKLLECVADWKNTQRMQEEMQSFSSPLFYIPEEPEHCWHRIGGAGRFSSKLLAVVKEVAAWRERTARSMDRPRQRILKDEQILEIASIQPSCIADLRRVTDFWQKNIQKFGEEILAAVRRGLDTPPANCPASVEMRLPLHEYKSRLARLQTLVKKRGENAGIDPILIASKKELSGIVSAAEDGTWASNHLLQGWRGELLGTTFLDLIATNFRT